MFREKILGKAEYLIVAWEPLIAIFPAFSDRSDIWVYRSRNVDYSRLADFGQVRVINRQYVL